VRPELDPAAAFGLSFAGQPDARRPDLAVTGPSPGAPQEVATGARSQPMYPPSEVFART
jgi:hypothetical protein